MKFCVRSAAAPGEVGGAGLGERRAGRGDLGGGRASAEGPGAQVSAGRRAQSGSRRRVRGCALEAPPLPHVCGAPRRRTWARPRAGSPARAGSGTAGGGGVPFPRLPYCFPDLSPASGRGGRGGRWLRRSPTSCSVALLKSTVAPSSWTPSAGQLSGDSRRATPVGVARLQGCVHRGSAALGSVL